MRFSVLALAVCMAVFTFSVQAQTQPQTAPNGRLEILLQEQKAISIRLAEAIADKATAKDQSKAEAAINRAKQDVLSINAEIGRENNAKNITHSEIKIATLAQKKPVPTQNIDTPEKAVPALENDYKPWDVFRQIPTKRGS
jgi:hypothetical protein